MLLEAMDELLIPFAEDYVKKSDNKWDDLVLPFLPQLRDALAEQIDKIDGQEG